MRRCAWCEEDISEGEAQLIDLDRAAEDDWDNWECADTYACSKRRDDMDSRLGVYGFYRSRMVEEIRVAGDLL